MVLKPGVTLVNVCRHFVSKVEGGTTDISWVQVKDAAKHPTMHATAWHSRELFGAIHHWC